MPDIEIIRSGRDTFMAALNNRDVRLASLRIGEDIKDLGTLTLATSDLKTPEEVYTAVAHFAAVTLLACGAELNVTPAEMLAEVLTSPPDYQHLNGALNGR